MMQTIEIYGRKIGGADCPWCVRAKALATRRGYAFRYIDITDDADLQAEFTTRTNGATTVPQIFVGITRVGGFTDFAGMDARGEIQQLIAGE